MLLITVQYQVDVQKRLDALKVEVDKRDQDIKQLQRGLKESENILVSPWFSLFSRSLKLY